LAKVEPWAIKKGSDKGQEEAAEAEEEEAEDKEEIFDFIKNKIKY
jgi:hypothetical protein